MFCLILKLCIALFITSLESSVSAQIVGSRSILRAIDANNNNNDNNNNVNVVKDYGVELNATDFDAVLRDTPATYSVVEFFANWCPACRNFKPQYEKVARLFNGADAIHPGIVLLTRVDCALKINGNLCDKFSIEHYPTLFWGPSAKFVSGSWDSKKEKTESDIQLIENGRSADLLLAWINKQLGSSYGLDDVKYENDHHRTNISDFGQIARAIYDVEEATATAFDIIFTRKMIKSETRASIIKFLQLLAAHHPTRRCRKGSAEILVNFDYLYPSKLQSASKLPLPSDTKKDSLENFQICGKEVPRGYWMFCRGSRNETRGYSCGLWVLLHSLSVRIDDGESQMAFKATCNFIHDYFVCEECREHFYTMCSSVTKPFETARDYVLWLWEAHNKVNERLIKEEAALDTGDPKFPKMIWPPKQLCSSCYESSEFNKDEVFKFLSEYYGATLITLYKDKEGIKSRKIERNVEELSSTNAIVVPVGAALAIALASCAFGGLACYWRSYQKNRKPRRSWN